jgi:hypothetical protein
MDLAGGVCSYTAYNIICLVVLQVDKETCLALSEDGVIKPMQGICVMPSVAKLQKAAAFVEKSASTLCPVIHQMGGDFGESIQFEYEPTLEFILHSFSLYSTKKFGLPTP